MIADEISKLVGLVGKTVKTRSGLSGFVIAVEFACEISGAFASRVKLDLSHDGKSSDQKIWISADDIDVPPG